MSSRWVRIAGYTAVALVQVALINGAVLLHRLSKTKMMVMRYLFAKNTELEAVWFSSDGRMAQVAVLALLAIALLALAVRTWPRVQTRFPAMQAGVGAILAGIAAALLFTVPTTTAIAVYAIVLALWVALAIQFVVIAVAFRLRRAEA